MYDGRFDLTKICLYDPDPHWFGGVPTRVLIYQNRVTNRHRGPNAMLLHVDCAAPMSRHNFVETTRFPSILDDMVAALAPPDTGTLRMDFGLAPSGVQVFDVGIYTVVLAPNAAHIPEALELVPAHKRPDLNQVLFEYYSSVFPPNWSVALCCFDASASPEPLMFWYTPENPAIFRAPALDEHTGGIPRVGEPVEVDHWLMVGAYWMNGGTEVGYTEWDTIPLQVRRLLPRYIRGARFTGQMPNGDFAIHSAMVQSQSHWLPRREVLRLPPPRLAS